jgi:sugar lactone lactonase YvrE
MTNPRPKMILLAFAATTFLATAAQAQLATVAVGPRPESITRGWHGKMYVSIQGPSGSLGVFDGEIRQVDLNTGVVTPFVSGLENPRGLTFTGKYLVTADQQKIVRIDEAGNKVVLATAAQFPFPAVFFNDCAASDDGKSVYVSEMGRRDIIRIGATPPANNVLIPTDSDAAYAVPATSRIYRVTMDGQIENMIEPSRKLLVINGLWETKKGKRMLAADFFHGNIVDVDFKKGTKNIIATAFRGIDGLGQSCDGTIFASSFENGQVWRMDENGENQHMLLGGVGFQSTADFYIDEAAHQLYVPDTLHGTVIILSTE